MGWGAVAALCPQKTLELGAERNRASFAEYLERELEALTHAFAAGAGSHARLCGGGVAAEAEGPSLAMEGRDYVAAFSGCVWLPCSGRVHSACLLGVVRLAALTWLHKVVQACCPTTCHLPWRPALRCLLATAAFPIASPGHAATGTLCLAAVGRFARFRPRWYSAEQLSLC